MSQIRTLPVHRRPTLAIAALALAAIAGSPPVSATQLTPGASVEIEAELTAKPLAFRTYRSYGDIPVPRGLQPNGLRIPGPTDYVTPLAPRLSSVPGSGPVWPRLVPRWPRVDPGTVACIHRYPTFNVLTGRYVANSGHALRCPFLP